MKPKRTHLLSPGQARTECMRWATDVQSTTSTEEDFLDRVPAAERCQACERRYRARSRLLRVILDTDLQGNR